MTKRTIRLIRNRGPNWDFEWNDEFNAFIHQTKKNVYRLSFGDFGTSLMPVMIRRRYVCSRGSTHWFPCEKFVRAKEIRYLGCKIVFCN